MLNSHINFERAFCDLDKIYRQQAILRKWLVSNRIYKTKPSRKALSISATVFRMVGRHGGFHRAVPAPMYILLDYFNNVLKKFQGEDIITH